MIELTISDNANSMTFGASLVVPIKMTQLINESDVETIDGNISTYYSSMKRQFAFRLLPMDQANYAELQAFVNRQYQNLKYPRITVTGAETMNVEDMTAKITLSDEEITNACGLVDNIQLTFRESRQMA